MEFFEVLDSRNSIYFLSKIFKLSQTLKIFCDLENHQMCIFLHINGTNFFLHLSKTNNYVNFLTESRHKTQEEEKNYVKWKRRNRMFINEPYLCYLYLVIIGNFYLISEKEVSTQILCIAMSKDISIFFTLCC